MLNAEKNESSVKVLSTEECLQLWKDKKYNATYRSFYSSWLGGITTEPQWMTLPMDDHMVHRGDGVFEAFRAIHGKIYLLKEHMDRLERSSELIGLKWPKTRDQVVNLIYQTLQASGLDTAIFRLFISRGPGGFSPSPYESYGSQLYIVVSDFKPMEESYYQQGVKVIIGKTPSKTGAFSQVKSCNYLPNVLLKKEALDQGALFGLFVDDQGFITESSTENLAYISERKEFVLPQFENILKGTTLIRLKNLIQEKHLMPIVQKNIRLEDLSKASEIFFVGTTLDVLPVSDLQGKSIPVGPWSARFRQLLIEDQSSI